MIFNITREKGKKMKIIEKVVKNSWYVLKDGFQLALFFLSIVGTYFTLLNPEKSEIGTETRKLILVLSVLVAYVIYLVMILICRRVTVYRNENKKIVVLYDDLIELIEKYENSENKAIFVIPVNRCFDTIVDDVIIETTSVHGQFIKYITKNIYKLDELDKYIDTSLKTYKFENVDISEKDKGKTKRYQVGTIAKIESMKGNIFYLLALPKFKKKGDKITVDESINMHEYLECLQAMVDYYKTDGRNLPIYMPTIGCGLSRLYISVDNAIKQLISIWNLNHDVIRDSVNIVVYKKDFWNIHIMKYKEE